MKVPAMAGTLLLNNNHGQFRALVSLIAVDSAFLLCNEARRGILKGVCAGEGAEKADG